jgi:hypothetical protein
MSANRLFLVCSTHPAIEDALCLGERATADTKYTASNLKKADAWFEKHQDCGIDHFALAYHRPKGWDLATPAPAVASAVRVAIAIDQIDHPAGADWREPKH